MLPQAQRAGVARWRTTPGGQDLLGEHGWELKRRGRGDHESWGHPRTGAQTVVDNNIKSRHLANEVLKQAGPPKAF